MKNVNTTPFMPQVCHAPSTDSGSGSSSSSSASAGNRTYSGINSVGLATEHVSGTVDSIDNSDGKKDFGADTIANDGGHSASRTA